ncbi:hypothetical protein OG921_23360 [Aldersonia sp. NBC_00410]|uniref:hypothetical protein n=1 Tax=Aldersonia sp. NBC_00410 TaxID=2975954 RepID=UPI002258E082|nr:hypothetical protein [Aldersonia sp. NBC_00410]MCX5046113.1 hypothetical protein [Aldersonia sp. NBC_00410]
MQISTLSVLAVGVAIAVTATVAPPRADAHIPESGPTYSASAAAIDLLTGADTDTDAAARAVPAGFAAAAGYQPTLVGGMLVNPLGNCSSPVSLPHEFEIPCKAHDLGYDILRYADRTGAPLGDWARKALDRQLDARLHTACDARSGVPRTFCFTMANVAATAVYWNSARQSYGTP